MKSIKIGKWNYPLKHTTTFMCSNDIPIKMLKDTIIKMDSKHFALICIEELPDVNDMMHEEFLRELRKMNLSFLRMGKITDILSTGNYLVFQTSIGRMPSIALSSCENTLMRFALMKCVRKVIKVKSPVVLINPYARLSEDKWKHVCHIFKDDQKIIIGMHVCLEILNLITYSSKTKQEGLSHWKNGRKQGNMQTQQG